MSYGQFDPVESFFYHLASNDHHWRSDRRKVGSSPDAGEGIAFSVVEDRSSIEVIIEGIVRLR
jgi:hypothetical protein